MLPGDDVTVYGVMYQRWKPFNDGSPCIVELVLRANNIEVYNQHAAATSVIKDAQKEFEDFWADYTHDPIEGKWKRKKKAFSGRISNITIPRKINTATTSTTLCDGYN